MPRHECHADAIRAGIVLRPLTLADAAALFTTHSDPESHIDIRDSVILGKLKP